MTFLTIKFQFSSVQFTILCRQAESAPNIFISALIFWMAGEQEQAGSAGVSDAIADNATENSARMWGSGSKFEDLGVWHTAPHVFPFRDPRLEGPPACAMCIEVVPCFESSILGAPVMPRVRYASHITAFGGCAHV
jgi:hypothetical protein